MEIASFDIAPMDKFWNWAFPNMQETSAMNSNFEALGFSSMNLIYNFGSMMLSYIAFPIISFFVAVLKCCTNNRKVVLFNQKMKNMIYWNSTITTLT